MDIVIENVTKISSFNWDGRHDGLKKCLKDIKSKMSKNNLNKLFDHAWNKTK